MFKGKPSNYRLLLSLLMILFVSILIYLIPAEKRLSTYGLMLRLRKLLAYAVVATMISFSTIAFQTMTGNRFLTPSVIGLESLYVLIQSSYLFFFWRWSASNLPNSRVEFFLVLAFLLGFVLCLQPYIKKLLDQKVVLLLLICMSFGTLFRSASTFMQVLMDPNEYDKLQSKLFASFQHINQDLLMVALGLTASIGFIFFKNRHSLDVLLLGRTTAQLLGVRVSTIQKQIFWAVVLLTATSTALIGPMSFFGFVVVHLVYRLLEDYHHSWLFLTASLLGFIVLVLGQLIVERLLHYTASISSVIELVGGTFFFYLLAKERNGK